MNCRYPNRPCKDRYRRNFIDRESVLCCRLPEWKKKRGVCPYDAKIHSKNWIAPGQKKLVTNIKVKVDTKKLKQVLDDLIAWSKEK